MAGRYIVDAYAWIEYLAGTSSGAKVNAIVGEEDCEVYTCAVTVAEVVSKVAREGRDAETAHDILVRNSQVVSVDDELSKVTGLLHAEMRKTKKDFGLADAYVLATARRLGSRILTGDPHFEDVEEAILIR
jgi:predicted nucleic acid-binding protein